MASAYLVGNITVLNPDKWAEYRAKVPDTIAPWGGELMFRGKLNAVLSGNTGHTDVVAIRFPSIDALENWHSSPEYQALIPIREEAAKMDLISYEE